VQLYVQAENSSIMRPKKELKGFQKVFLKAGESRQVNFVLDARSFAYYNVSAADWAVEGGAYKILVGASSRDIRLETRVRVEGDGKESLLAGQKTAAPDYFSLGSPQTAGGPLPASVPQTAPVRRPVSVPLQIGDASFQAVLGRPIPPHAPDPTAPYTINTPYGDLRGSALGRLVCRFVESVIDKFFGNDSEAVRKRELSNAMESPLHATHMMERRMKADKIALLLKVLNSPLNRRKS
jgi:beta-glucosidase